MTPTGKICDVRIDSAHNPEAITQTRQEVHPDLEFSYLLGCDIHAIMYFFRYLSLHLHTNRNYFPSQYTIILF